MRFTSGFLAAIALLILAALAVSYFGVVNVAAREPDNPVSAWFLSNTMQRSVRQQASGIAAPRQASEEEVNPGGRPKVPARSARPQWRSRRERSRFSARSWRTSTRRLRR